MPIWSSLAGLFRANPAEQQANELYITLAAQSRKEFFYETLHVPDTLDGRHEMLLLHLFLILHRLKLDPNAARYKEFSQALIETHFSNMDLSLREMGVGDTGVGRRIQRMAEAFYGRMRAYESTFMDTGAFTDSLLRNVYGTTTAERSDADQLAHYARKTLALLKAISADELMKEGIPFKSATIKE